MKLNPRGLTLAILGALCTMATLPALAAQDADIDSVRAATARLISQLVDQGVLTKDKGSVLLDEVSKPAAAPQGAPAAGSSKSAGATPGTVRVPYIPEYVRNEMKEEIRLELAAQAFREGWTGPNSVPAWVRGMEWDGDLRMRMQMDRFASGNAPYLIDVNNTNKKGTVQLLNTTENRDRLRFRGRLGMTVKIDDNWSGGFRLSTGNADDPLSANQTLGNFDNRYTVLADRAYIRYRYADQFNVVMGRFGNPWFSTDMMWANDLSFDGVAAQWTPAITPDWRGFVTLGALPVQEVQLSSADKWLLGAQVGATLTGSPQDIRAKVGLAYYAYKNMLGEPNPAGSTQNDFTAPAFTQKGNTYYNISSNPAVTLLGLAAEYQLIDLTGQIDLPSYAGKRLVLTGDYARNLAFNSSEVTSRTGLVVDGEGNTSSVDGQVNAYHVRAAFGDVELKKAHDWQVFVAYKRVERDALLDAFTDSDFHLGGTDTKGYILGGSYGLAKNTYLTFRYLSADQISGPPLGIDVFQFDLNVKF